MMELVTKQIEVEELVEKVPQSVAFLRERGIVCILCGEPVWGTLENLAKSKGFSDGDIDQVVEELNELLRTL